MKAEEKSKLNIGSLSQSYVYEESNNVMPGIAQMCKKVLVQKKINVSEEDLIQTVSDMYSAIRYFNSFDEYTSLIFGGTDIKEVKVLNEFKDFIVPAAVRFDPTDLRSKNLAIKESVNSAPMSYLEYVNLCDKFRSYFKKDASTDMASLADLKKSVTLTSVIDKASNQIDGGFKVNYGTQVYYPLRLEDITVLYEERHFNASESDLMSDYLSNFRF